MATPQLKGLNNDRRYIAEISEDRTTITVFFDTELAPIDVGLADGAASFKIAVVDPRGSYRKFIVPTRVTTQANFAILTLPSFSYRSGFNLVVNYDPLGAIFSEYNGGEGLIIRSAGNEYAAPILSSKRINSVGNMPNTYNLVVPPYVIASSISPIPEISVSANKLSANEDPLDQIIFTLTRTGDTSSSLEVYFSFKGSADGRDYTKNVQAGTSYPYHSILFNAGSPTAAIVVTPKRDASLEQIETLGVNLETKFTSTLNESYRISSVGRYSEVKIIDKTPEVTMNLRKNPVTEDSGESLIFEFQRFGDFAEPLTVYYSMAGSADRSDYRLSQPDKIYFSAGQSSVNLVVTPIKDSIIEPDEEVTVNLIDSPFIKIDNYSETGSIFDDDGPIISVSLNQAFIREDDGKGLYYEFKRSGDVDQPLAFKFSFGGMAYYNDDYVALGLVREYDEGNRFGIAYFNKGASSTWIKILPSQDFRDEPDETVTVSVVPNPSRYGLRSATATATIIDVDPPEISVLLNQASVQEDGSENLVFTFTRTGNLGKALQVKYLVGGTAGVSDYKRSPRVYYDGDGYGYVSFGPGENTAKLTIDPSKDYDLEENETVIVSISDYPGNYVVGSSKSATGIIKNDDILIKVKSGPFYRKYRDEIPAYDKYVGKHLHHFPKQPAIITDSTITLSPGVNKIGVAVTGDRIVPGKKTVVYIHGWRDNSLTGPTTTMVEGLAASPLYKDSQILVVDWKEAANAPIGDNNGLYYSLNKDVPFVSAHNVTKVANYLATWLQELDILPSDTTLIGHSLGSFVAGKTAELIKSRTGDKIQKIVALDPASIGPNANNYDIDFETAGIQAPLPFSLDYSKQSIAFVVSDAFSTTGDFAGNNVHAATADLAYLVDPVGSTGTLDDTLTHQSVVAAYADLARMGRDTSPHSTHKNSLNADGDDIDRGSVIGPVIGPFDFDGVLLTNGVPGKEAIDTRVQGWMTSAPNSHIDALTGTPWNDVISYPDTNVDEIYGLEGDDLISVFGRQVAIGGPGADRFYINNAGNITYKSGSATRIVNQTATIHDFAIGQDKIILPGRRSNYNINYEGGNDYCRLMLDGVSLAVIGTSTNKNAFTVSLDNSTQFEYLNQASTLGTEVPNGWNVTLSGKGHNVPWQ